MSKNERAVQEGFDNDPTNPQWAIALGLYAIANAIRDTDLQQEVQFIGEKLRNIAAAIEMIGQ